MFGSPTLWVSGRWVSCLSDLLFSRFPKDIHIFRAPGSWNWQNRELRNTYRGVDLKKTRFVPGRFSCTNSPPSCTWRKVVDGYNRNIFSLPNHHIRISRAFATLVRPIVRNTGCDPLFLQHLLVWPIVFYNTSNSIKTRQIKRKQGPRIQSWISKLCFLISRNY